MKRFAWILVCLFLFAARAYGQGAASDTILGPQVQVKPGASVTICSHPSTVLTCPANKVTIYSDLALTTPTTNPTTTDAQGRFLVYAPAGTYDYIVTGSAITAQATVFTFTVPGSGTGCIPGGGAGALQKNNSGSCNPAAIIDNGTIITASEPAFVPSLNNVVKADLQSGASAGAKINNCMLSLVSLGGGVCDARGLTGSQTISSNVFASVTVPVQLILGMGTYSVSATQSPTVEGSSIAGQSKRAGLNSGGTILIWTGAANGTMVDSSGTSDFTLTDLHMDGASNGATAWKLGGIAPNFWQHGRNLFINSFSNNAGSGAIFFGAGSNFVSDTDFYSVQISDCQIGLQGVIQDAFFYNLDIISASQQAVVLFGNSHFEQFGGHYGLNGQDVALTGSNTIAGFHGVWFENSTSGILDVPGAISSITLNFIDNHLSTTAISGSLIDTTNITGTVNFNGNTIVQQSGTSTTTINLASTLTKSVQSGNTGATWTGTPVSAFENPLTVGTLPVPPLASGFTSGHCPEPTESAGVWTLVDTGSACGSGGSGLSGMTATQVPIAATPSTVTSSKAIVGSDAGLASAGTISTTAGTTACADANGGVTTTSCMPSQYDIVTAGASGVPSGSSNLQYGATAGLFSHSETGVFTNTQSNFYNEFTLGSSGCNPQTVIAKLNAIQSTYGTANWTDSLSGCVDVPSGTTNGQSIAVNGYAINDNSTAGPYGGSYALGVNGGSYCRVASSECEGIVGLALDNASLSGVVLVPIESGAFPQNTTDTVYGNLFSPFSQVQPTTMIAYYLHADGGYSALATSGFECGTGSLTTTGTFYRRCIVLNPIAFGAIQYSQSLDMRTTNTSGTVVDNNLIAAPDVNGKSYLRFGMDSKASGASPALLPDHAGTNSLSPNANLTFGTCTMSSGTCTYTFINAYTTAPICSATWNGTGTLTGILKAVPGTSSVVVTSTIGTDNDAVNIVCGPQAN